MRNDQENWLRLIIWGILCIGLGLVILKGNFSQDKKIDKQLINLTDKEAKAIREEAIRETILFIQKTFERDVNQKSQSHFTKRDVFEMFKDSINFKK